MHSADRNQKRGFTLIELLVVIIIIAIMASVIVPAYVRFLDHARFREKVREVQDIFAYAREQAVSLNTPVTLKYNAQFESFTVTLPTPPSDTDQPVAISGSEPSESQTASAPRSVQLASNQSVGRYILSASPMATNSPNESQQDPGGGANAGPNDLHFQGDGTVEGLEMDITQSDGAHAHLTLAPSTGRLVIDPGKSV